MRGDPNWAWALLSKAAKERGGPEKYVEAIFQDGFKEGLKRGIITTIIVFAILLVLSISIIMLIEYLRKKKNIPKEDIDAAKKKLISGIQEYDSSHQEC